MSKRVPGITKRVTRRVGGDGYGLQPTLICLDLGKVPDSVKAETLRALALGSRLTERGEQSVRYDSRKPRSTLSLVETQLMGFAGGFVGAILAMWIGTNVAPDMLFPEFLIFIIGPFLLGQLAGLALWLKRGSIVVSLTDAVVVEVDVAKLPDNYVSLAQTIQGYLDALDKEAPHALTEELWLAGYQAQADLAAANKLLELPEEPAKERAETLYGMVRDFSEKLRALVSREVWEIQARKEKEAEEAAQRQKELENQQTREALSTYLDVEPHGNVLELEPAAETDAAKASYPSYKQFADKFHAKETQS